MRQLIAEHPYQLKFVIDTPADCEQVERYLEELPGIDRARVMLMPQGVDQAELLKTTAWLEPYCDKHGLRLCPRKHIEWYGLARGT